MYDETIKRRAFVGRDTDESAGSKRTAARGTHAARGSSGPDREEPLAVAVWVREMSGATLEEVNGAIKVTNTSNSPIRVTVPVYGGRDLEAGQILYFRNGYFFCEKCGPIMSGYNPPLVHWCDGCFWLFVCASAYECSNDRNFYAVMSRRFGDRWQEVAYFIHDR